MGGVAALARAAGHEVTAIDIAPSAVLGMAERANARGLEVRALEEDQCRSG